MSTEYVCVSDHAENLQSGAMIGPGSRVNAEALGDEDQWLLDEGRLVPAEPAAELSGDDLKARAAELNIEGRSKMTADELRDAVAAAEQPNTED